MINDNLSKLSQLLDEKLEGVEKRLDQRLGKRLDEKLEGVERRLGKKVEDEVRLAEHRLDESISTKIETPFLTYRNKIMTRLDGIAGSLKKNQEEDAAHQLQHENLSDLPELVEKLEDLHPDGQHPRQSP